MYVRVGEAGEEEIEETIDAPVEEFVPGLYVGEVTIEEGDREYIEQLLRESGMSSEQFFPMDGPFLGETLEHGLMLFPEDFYRELVDVRGEEFLEMQVIYDLPHLNYQRTTENYGVIYTENFEVTFDPGGQSFSGTMTATLNERFAFSGSVIGELREPISEEELEEAMERIRE